MSNVELLPLPKLPRQVEGYSSDYWEAGQVEEYATDYARANVAHAAAEKDAVIEALREYKRAADKANETLRTFVKVEEARTATAEARAERLAEALRDVMGWVSTDNYFTDEPMQALARARAALHPTAAQENDDA